MKSPSKQLHKQFGTEVLPAHCLTNLWLWLFLPMFRKD